MKISKDIVRILTVAVITGLLVVGVVSAQTWNAAPSNPPTNNAPAPINVSLTSQNKAGNFVANAIGANAFCMGSDCISAWPTAQPAEPVLASDIVIVKNNAGAGNTIRAVCPSGFAVISGGYERTGNIGGSVERTFSSFPDTWKSWTVYYPHANFIAYAVCLKV